MPKIANLKFARLTKNRSLVICFCWELLCYVDTNEKFTKIHFRFKCNFLFIHRLFWLEKQVIFINNLQVHTSLYYYSKSSIAELSLPLSSGGSSVSSVRASWRGTPPLQYKKSLKTMLSIFTHMHIMLPFIIKPPRIKLMWSMLYTAFLSPCSKNHFPIMWAVDERWPDLFNCCQVKKKTITSKSFHLNHWNNLIHCQTHPKYHTFQHLLS